MNQHPIVCWFNINNDFGDPAKAVLPLFVRFAVAVASFQPYFSSSFVTGDNFFIYLPVIIDHCLFLLRLATPWLYPFTDRAKRDSFEPGIAKQAFTSLAYQCQISIACRGCHLYIPGSIMQTMPGCTQPILVHRMLCGPSCTLRNGSRHDRCHVGNSFCGSIRHTSQYIQLCSLCSCWKNGHRHAMCPWRTSV